MDTKIGVVDLPRGKKWDPLPIDKSILKIDDKKPSPVPQRNVAEGDVIALPPGPSSEQKSLPTNKDYFRKMLEQMYPWDDEEEPLDIERNIENVTVVEIIDYEKFLKKTSANLQETGKTGCEQNTPVKLSVQPKDENYNFKSIKMFEKQTDAFGPQLWHFYQVLMASKSQDVVNLERLETLGDSFLKFATTLFLFLRYPNYNEGRLTNMKGKIIGNRNLFYIGQNKNIGGLMKLNEFSPSSEWLPPGFSVPQILHDYVNNNEIQAGDIFDFTFDREERKTGN